MQVITQSPGALRLFALSLLARLPLAMMSVGLLVHVEGLTGSLAPAGLVAGTFAASNGIGAPLLGRVIDRRGQTRVLLAGAAIAGGALLTIAALPASAPLGALVALAAALGLAFPPVGACLRALLPTVLPDEASVRASYAAESAILEVTWIAGPPLVLLLGSAWSTGGAMALAGLVLLAGTTLFAAHPASRGWRPTGQPRPAGGAMRSPGMQTLALVLFAAGWLFGSVEVSVVAAADELGHPGVSGVLLGIWGAGSLLGGLVAARLGGGARTAAGLAVILAVLTVGHLALAGASGNLLALGLVLPLGGALIAPMFATVFSMVDAATPAGTVTEAFACLNTAVAVGAALGAVSAGTVADQAGAGTAFGLAAAAGLAAALVATVRARTLA
ncbi:MFS transporter [Paraconexibacter algicola]|uniref:MFS transporter n=1 Tax=Paraconexibacter algicola TaxID=2133960 RepID=A0A2T4UBJ4_9ACTN|nr:MFS transporter [Paraconexibacter algicola]PTL54265.1 MFS transporter [Paraconexibacter algicola]